MVRGSSATRRRQFSAANMGLQFGSSLFVLSSFVVILGLHHQLGRRDDLDSRIPTSTSQIYFL